VPYCQKYTATDCFFGDFSHWGSPYDFLSLSSDPPVSVKTSSVGGEVEDDPAIIQLVRVTNIFQPYLIRRSLYFSKIIREEFHFHFIFQATHW